MKRCVLFHDSAEGAVAEKAPLHHPTHHERLVDFHPRGLLLGVGTFAEPREGRHGDPQDREAAEEFAGEGPFVLNGVVGYWYVREWNDILAEA